MGWVEIDLRCSATLLCIQVNPAQLSGRKNHPVLNYTHKRANRLPTLPVFHDPRLHGLLVLGHPPLLGHGELAGLLLLHARLDDAVDVELVADETPPCVGCSVIN